MSGFVAIGEVRSAHGVGGEMRVLPLTDFPRRFCSTSRVFLVPPGRALDDPRAASREARVVAARVDGPGVLLQLEGVDSPEEAKRLRGFLLAVPRAEVVPLPAGHYYLFEVVGLAVYTVAGEFLGRVRDVLRTGANDVYVVAPPPRGAAEAAPEGGGPAPEILVPALREVVRELDPAAGRMVVDLPPGLREEPRPARPARPARGRRRQAQRAE